MVGKYVVASVVQKLIAIESNKVIDGNHWNDMERETTLGHMHVIYCHDNKE